MGHWTLDDIAWDRFDRRAVDPEIVRIVKAASLVEYNGDAYAHHLCRIFGDDPSFQMAARRGARPMGGAGRARVRFRGRVRPLSGGLPGRFRPRRVAPRLALGRDGG